MEAHVRAGDRWIAAETTRQEGRVAIVIGPDDTLRLRVRNDSACDIAIRCFQGGRPDPVPLLVEREQITFIPIGPVDHAPLRVTLLLHETWKPAEKPVLDAVGPGTREVVRRSASNAIDEPRLVGRTALAAISLDVLLRRPTPPPKGGPRAPATESRDADELRWRRVRRWRR